MDDYGVEDELNPTEEPFEGSFTRLMDISLTVNADEEQTQVGFSEVGLGRGRERGRERDIERFRTDCACVHQHSEWFYLYCSTDCVYLYNMCGWVRL
jgi:hypothetical protein